MSMTLETTMSSPTCTSIDQESFNRFFADYLKTDPLTLYLKAEKENIITKFTTWHIYGLVAVITGLALGAVQTKRATSHLTTRIHAYITTPLHKKIACIVALVYSAMIAWQTTWLWDLCRSLAIVVWWDRPAEHVAGCLGLQKYFHPCWVAWIRNAGSVAIFAGSVGAWCLFMVYVQYQVCGEILWFRVPDVGQRARVNKKGKKEAAAAGP
ncbi:hypothetical protein BDV19DRAFT_367364 [Aspergillus venezuelensis]